MLFRKKRRPFRSGEKFDDRYFTQEGDCLEQQHGDDARGNQHRCRRAREQSTLDTELDDATLPIVHFAWPLNRCSRLTFGSDGADASNIVPVVFAENRCCTSFCSLSVSGTYPTSDTSGDADVT